VNIGSDQLVLFLKRVECRPKLTGLGAY